MSSKSPRWRKVLLASGLMLVLVQGLVRLPEVRGRLFPGLFWEQKLRLAQKESLKVERRLRYIGAILEELDETFDQDGFQITPGPFKELLVLAQWWVNLPELWGRLLPKMTYETKLRLAQKECIDTERSLKHINAIVEALNRALEHRVPQGAASSMPTASGLGQARDLTQAISQRCWEYRHQLQGLLQKWQELKVSQGNKAGLKSGEKIVRQ